MRNHGLKKIAYCLVTSVISFSVFASERLGQEEHQLLDRLRKETPTISYSGPLAVANLNLNHKGSVIIAEPGEKVFGMLHFEYDTEDLEAESLNQIIIGFSDSGPQKCIFNEFGYRCSEGIASFYLQVPESPGIYEVQCKFEQADSPNNAIDKWDEESLNSTMTIGKIIVRE
ncbi:MAG: hypothetical protein FJZ57_01620 [Chlamydiae bacterium]|nr:hypothetical protein [Chlamydiota bacterium]